MHIESSEVAARPLPTASAQESVENRSNEIAAKATRRRFTLAYKRKIVALATGLPSGEVGALLRREALYSSHLTHWRQLDGTPKKWAMKFASLTGATIRRIRHWGRSWTGSSWCTVIWAMAAEVLNFIRDREPFHADRWVPAAEIKSTLELNFPDVSKSNEAGCSQFWRESLKTMTWLNTRRRAVAPSIDPLPSDPVGRFVTEPCLGGSRNDEGRPRSRPNRLLKYLAPR